jgi:hypothetical protein
MKYVVLYKIFFFLLKLIFINLNQCAIVIYLVIKYIYIYNNFLNNSSIISYKFYIKNVNL